MRSVQKIMLGIFVAVPFIEMYLLIQVGGIIGVFPTIMLVMLTAVIGAGLLRYQGFSTWQRLQSNLAQGIMPAYELIEGLLLLLGGLLLLTPGFFTDALGFACMIPAVRQKVARYAIEHHLFSVIDGSAFQSSKKTAPDALEGEFKREDN
ncbi:MAG: FxsA family protein [Methylococcaceae bacterium]|nr:FxsA family protein [Methylococcaceae bacterium]